MSTLAAVIGNNPLNLDDWKAQFVHLARGDPLAKFHAKFWGVKEVAADTKKDEGDMEIDSSTAEDDDIDPSCYVLNIGIQGAQEEKIWVRTEYIRMFEFAEKFYAENSSQPLSPCLIITGQPGIVFGAGTPYEGAVRKKKPVIFYSDGACWLFVEEGVFKQPTSFESRFYNTVVWTLVDSIDAPSGLPIGLITHLSRHFVIYTTSPTPSRWNKLHQSMEQEICVMNPWTKAEIHRAAPFRAPGMSLTAIDAIFYELGPIPRLCFGNERSLILYRETLKKTLRNLTLSKLEDMSMDNLALDAVSHMIYMLRRHGVGVDSVDIDVEIISPFIAAEVVRRLRELKRQELANLFKLYSAIPSTRKISGDIFEAYCHVIFSEMIKFDFIPMVRIGGQPTAKEKKKSPQWHSSHSEFRGLAQSELEALRINALASMASLDISHPRVVDYDSKEVAAGLYIEADVYYMPVKPNQIGIDSFIRHDNNLYLLKMTVSDTHEINDELLPFLVSLKGLPPKSYWHFIFIKPPRKILTCPVPGLAELCDLKLYSAEVEVK